MEILRAISFVASVGAVSAFLFLAVIRPFFSPPGWTKKENEGVAVRFKVFLPLYLKNPEKWKLMPDAARYENMMVYFSTGLQWRKYNRWRKRVRKQRQKAEQEERKQKFMEAIFKEYEPKPNPEFTPPPTLKPKTNKDKPTNAECDKIRADLELSENIYLPTDPRKLKAEIKRWADSVDWGINPMELAVKAAIEQYKEGKQNPRCKDCKHMRYRHNDNGKIDTVCVKHKTACGFEPIFPAMVACGVFEERRR